MPLDEHYLSRSLALARKGAGHVSPNPMVGAVIVHEEGQVIGEGYHARYGEPHAEVNAINRVQDAELLKASTLYVNLEPCAHHGQTPPCSNRIIEEGIPRVVIGCRDENARVQGAGIRQMEGAGIAVKTGVLEKEARWLNRRFFTYHQEQRPYISLKWAQSADGFLADESGNSGWISNPYSRIYVHKWRHEEDAILAGYGTISQDDPALTARSWQVRHPLRIALDRNLRIPASYQLYGDDVATWFVNEQQSGPYGKHHLVKISQMENFHELLQVLYHNRVASLFVEGGAKVLQTLVGQGAWDEARVFTGPVHMKKGKTAPQITGTPAGRHQIGNDELK